MCTHRLRNPADQLEGMVPLSGLLLRSLEERGETQTERVDSISDPWPKRQQYGPETHSSVSPAMVARLDGMVPLK